jgi:hypothetical protein
MPPMGIGLSVRPAAASRRASNASLDQPIESRPAATASVTSRRPSPRRAASPASTVIMAVMASEGPACAGASLREIAGALGQLARDELKRGKGAAPAAGRR